MERNKKMVENILDGYMKRNADRFKLEDIEDILIKVFEGDDSHVVSMIVENIRAIEGMEGFATGACFEDYTPDPDPCPHCINKEMNTARVIYGYSDDDTELNDRDGKDLYLAGCVPDSYGVDFVSPDGERTWFYPTRFCNECKKFFMYEIPEKAISERP
jgi:hypothetical protein